MEIPILECEAARLSPLSMNNYHHLLDIASEENLLQHSLSDISSPEKLNVYVAAALQAYDEGRSMPFLIFDKRVQRYAGSTRFGLIDARNRVLHIGWTWLGRGFRGTGLNWHIKFLRLHYAFEVLHFEKVEFRIDERNLSSRKAVEKLGAVLEGILRKDVFKRNTCCYGILKGEWAKIKEGIF